LLIATFLIHLSCGIVHHVIPHLPALLL
jgi:hypothetical protein